MATSTSSGIAKKLVINAYKQKLALEAKEKYAKKGLLVKILNSNAKRTNTLVEILKESNNFATINNSQTTNDSKTTHKSTDDEYLKKFRTMPKGGPSHKIATSRAHHLSNFLTEYIINAFQSGLFSKPDLDKFAHLHETDLNGFKKNKYEFDLSNIELLSDLTALKIHWLISGVEEIDAEIERFFESKLKNEIRNKLVSERVINYVPRIVFIRDETNCLLNKLDEYLMKIKLDLSKTEENEPEKESRDVFKLNNEIKQNDPDDMIKKKTVNNLYGVNFERLLEMIKKDNSFKSGVEVKRINEDENELVNVKKEEQYNVDKERVKFESSLKAFKINKKLKQERMNKSAILKLSQIEFEDFKEKSLRSNKSEDYDDNYEK